MAARKTKSQGRKSDKPLRDALMMAINREAVDPITKKRVKRLYIIADRLSMRACKDTVAAREVWDRVEGKAAQRIEYRHIGGWSDLEQEELESLARDGEG